MDDKLKQILQDLAAHPEFENGKLYFLSSNYERLYCEPPAEGGRPRWVKPIIFDEI
ncbi:hypothetical protein [Roseobacter litoralis]|uniref:hypothetical protein n=1 Tax=Roseobacter litoralis TaxID=42443 RepID=UPI000160EB0F|nr:hypothetical protein [Roseobacter litoralis]